LERSASAFADLDVEALRFPPPRLKPPVEFNEGRPPPNRLVPLVVDGNVDFVVGAAEADGKLL
jgi:hypothetical protein